MLTLSSQFDFHNCRRLFLCNYEARISIGVHEHEKKQQQRILINVDLYIPLALSTPKDDLLDEVVDYDLIRETIQKRLAVGHIQLQETLCDDIAAALLMHAKVKAVCVSTSKPDVYPDCESVGVQVFRFKPDTSTEANA